MPIHTDFTFWFIARLQMPTIYRPVGRVVDESGEAIINAYIFDLVTRSYTLSDTSGYFCIEVNQSG